MVAYKMQEGAPGLELYLPYQVRMEFSDGEK